MRITLGSIGLFVLLWLGLTTSIGMTNVVGFGVIYATSLFIQFKIRSFIVRWLTVILSVVVFLWLSLLFAVSIFDRVLLLRKTNEIHWIKQVEAKPDICFLDSNIHISGMTFKVLSHRSNSIDNSSIKQILRGMELIASNSRLPTTILFWKNFQDIVDVMIVQKLTEQKEGMVVELHSSNKYFLTSRSRPLPNNKIYIAAELFTDNSISFIDAISTEKLKGDSIGIKYARDLTWFFTFAGQADYTASMRNNCNEYPSNK